MATNYPTAIDTLTNPAAADKLNVPPHDSQHTDENDAIEAIQNRLGTGSDTTPGAADKLLLSTSPTATQWTTLESILSGGWVASGETWTYASASTFTITGDKTSKYSIDMKLMLTQTTVKYFTITDIVYSSPNTTITVNGGGTYTVANAAITFPFYSTAYEPLGFPLSTIPIAISKTALGTYTPWATWSPSYGGESGLTFSSVSTTVARWVQIGKTIWFELLAGGITGSTAAGRGISFTLPVAPALTNTIFSAGGNLGGDVYFPITANVFASGTTVFCRIIDFASLAGGNWGDGGSRTIWVKGFYEVA